MIKKILGLTLGALLLVGCATVGPPKDLEKLAEQGTTIYARAFTALTGGGTGALDKVPVAQIGDTGTMAWVTTSGKDLYFYRFNATASETSDNPPYWIRPDDYSSAGVWYLIDSLYIAGTSTPTVLGTDSDQNFDTVWLLTGNGIGDGSDSVVDIKGRIGDSNVTFIQLDGTNETLELSYALANIPQSKDYSSSDDDDETVGVDITSSVVLVTGDDDTDADSIDLQDGTVNGQTVTFIAVAGQDANDGFTIDASTDSTCTGCPTMLLDTVGDSAILRWSGSAWFYVGGYEQ